MRSLTSVWQPRHPVARNGGTVRRYLTEFIGTFSHLRLYVAGPVLGGVASAFVFRIQDSGA
jgi:hypothetical protein